MRERQVDTTLSDKRFNRGWKKEAQRLNREAEETRVHAEFARREKEAEQLSEAARDVFAQRMETSGQQELSREAEKLFDGTRTKLREQWDIPGLVIPVFDANVRSTSVLDDEQYSFDDAYSGTALLIPRIGRSKQTAFKKKHITATWDAIVHVTRADGASSLFGNTMVAPDVVDSTPEATDHNRNVVNNSPLQSVLFEMSVPIRTLRNDVRNANGWEAKDNSHYYFHRLVYLPSDQRDTDLVQDPRFNNYHDMLAERMSSMITSRQRYKRTIAQPIMHPLDAPDIPVETQLAAFIAGGNRRNMH